MIFFAGGTGNRDTEAPAEADPGGGGEASGSGAVGVRTRPRRARKHRDLRPLIIIAGLITSFSVFTLAGSALLSALGLPQDFLRWAGVVILAAVGRS
ncbi:hypothetical protein [Glycomyces sp. NPDC047010]|uniref:hypothetical protein n=1 Tax=Glycomyces sp. NPDC047010 TaxID=3155023 RepID=UPI0033C40716